MKRFPYISFSGLAVHFCNNAWIGLNSSKGSYILNEEKNLNKCEQKTKVSFYRKTGLTFIGKSVNGHKCNGSSRISC